MRDVTSLWGEDLVRFNPEKPQTSVDVCATCHGAGWLRVAALPGEPGFGQRVPCPCKEAELRSRRMRHLLRQSHLEGMEGITFEVFDLTRASQSVRRAHDTVKRYAEGKMDKPWLLLYGGTGVGKTRLAVAAANYRMAQGQQVVFVVAPELLDDLRRTYGANSSVDTADLLDAVKNAPFLVIDDYGTGMDDAKPWQLDKFFQIFNNRSNRSLPTVITTNLSPSDIEPRLRSRVLDNHLTSSIRLDAGDNRL